jgi:hypothetical protein
MTDEERDVFLRCARQLVGTHYDIARCVFADCISSKYFSRLMFVRWWIVRAFQLVLRLALKHITGTSPLRKLPISVDPNSWICSDAIMYGLLFAHSKTHVHWGSLTNPMWRGGNRVLLAGCSEKFREVLAKARQESELGTTAKRDAACLLDLSTLLVSACTKTFSRLEVRRCPTSHAFARHNRTHSGGSRFRLWSTH